MQRRSFMKLMATSAVGVGASAAMSGCKVKGGGNSIQPYMRFVSLATGQKFTVNVFNGTNTGSLLNNSITLDTTATGTPNGAFSEYAQIDWEGTYAVELLPPGTTNVNAAYGATTVSPAQGSHYTGFVFPASSSTTTTTSLGCSVYNDDPQTVSSGQYIIRMMNTMATAAEAAEFDLYLTTAGTTSSSLPVGSSSDLTSAVTPVLSSVSGMTAYTTGATSGTFRVRLTVAGNKQKVVFDADNITLSSGGAYTLVTYTLGSATLPTVMLLTPSGDPVILTNSLTRIRVIQGSSDVTGVASGSSPALTSQILINGAKVTLATTFGSATTSYTIVPAGKIPVQFQISGASTPYLSITNQTFVGGQDYSVYSTTPSTAATPGYLVQVDNNLPLTNGTYAGVTFVNATQSGDPQASSVDFTIDSQLPPAPATTPISSGVATQMTLISANVDHVVAFLDANHADALLAKVDMGTLVAGAIYTVAVVGTGNASETGSFAAVCVRTNVFG